MHSSDVPPAAGYANETGRRGGSNAAPTLPQPKKEPSIMITRTLAFAALAGAIAVGAAHAQYVTTPYGNGGVMVTPYNGTTLNNNQPMPQPFVVPNMQHQFQQPPQVVPCFPHPPYGHC
jgi:hypothetical protein